MKIKLRQMAAFLLSGLILIQIPPVLAEGVISDVAAESVSAAADTEITAEKTKEKTILYVAKDGKDTNSGTADSPFASVEKARDTIRALKKDGKLAESGAVVYIREGEYVIQKGIGFTSEDAGSEGAPIVYRAYPGEKVKFLGGVSIPWDKFKSVTNKAVLDRVVDKSVRDKLVEADLFALGFKNLPELTWPGAYSYAAAMIKVHGKTQPNAIAPELFINGTPMTIARYPNEKQMIIDEVIDKGAVPRNWEDDTKGSASYVPESERKSTPFIIKLDDDRVLNWDKAEDALITGTFYYSWADQTVAVKSFDKGVVTSAFPSYYSVLKGQYVHVYNLLEEIDMPGEYYVDRKNGKMYLYPPDERVTSVVYTSLEEYMFGLNNTQYIEIKDIDMSYMRSGAVLINNSQNCKVSDCEISYTGKVTILTTGTNTKNNVIKDCHIHDVEVGIDLQGGDRNTLTPGNNVIENCEFERCDRITKSISPAISLKGVGNKAIHNKVHDAEHMLVLFSGNDHVIAYNEIYDACTNTDDMGAVYAGRDLTSRGNQIMYNYLHDVGGADRGVVGVHGIYLDDFFSWAHVTCNIIENIQGYGVISAGSHNVLHNNIFINMTGAAHLARSYNYGSDSAANINNEATFQQRLDAVPYLSEAWTSRYPEIVDVKDENGRFDINRNLVAQNNVIINSGGIELSEEVRRTATEGNNISYSSDPGFYNMEEGNYLLNRDSKVYKDIPDFKVIPFTRIGTYSDRALVRIKDAYALTLDSPFAYKKGEFVNNESVCVIEQDGKYYIPVRLCAEIIGGEVLFDEQTEKVTLASNDKVLSFTNGNASDVTVNAAEYQLKNPIVNKDHTNYISVNDFAEIFAKQVIHKDGVLVISDIESLFTPEEDDNLLRYIKDRLSIY